MDANVINQAGEETGCIEGVAGTNVLVRQEKRAASFILTALQFGDTNCTLCPAFSPPLLGVYHRQLGLLLHCWW